MQGCVTKGASVAARVSVAQQRGGGSSERMFVLTRVRRIPKYYMIKKSVIVRS
jgi:hypothetical protein